MSEQGKIYCPGSAKQISPKLLKLNFPVAEFLALVKQHERNGWISIGVSPRKEVGPKGQTHSAWIDLWQPGQPSTESEQPADAQTAKAALQAAREAINAAPQPTDDVPF